MKTLTNYFLLFFIIFLASCGDDDGGNSTSKPSLSSAKTDYQTAFFTAGQTEKLAINWNGEEGTLSLSPDITGISISTDGVVSWSKKIPLGENSFTVTATNSIGSSTVNLKINNNFQGNFEGMFNEDPNSDDNLSGLLKYSLNEDGTMSAENGNDSGTGTWSIDGNKVTASYNYGADKPRLAIMDLTYDENDAMLKGIFYLSDTSDDPVHGHLELNIKE